MLRNAAIIGGQTAFHNNLIFFRCIPWSSRYSSGKPMAAFTPKTCSILFSWPPLVGLTNANRFRVVRFETARQVAACPPAASVAQSRQRESPSDRRQAPVLAENKGHELFVVVSTAPSTVSFVSGFRPASHSPRSQLTTNAWLWRNLISFGSLGRTCLSC